MRNFGCDPEYFIVGNSNSIPGDIIPPAALIADLNFEVIGLTKNNKRILYEGNKYRFIEDGSAAELNLLEPIDDDTQFYNIIACAKEEFSRYLMRGCCSLLRNVVGDFNINKYWKDRDETFTDCVRFGCDPDAVTDLYRDFDTGCKNIDASTHTKRYAGGHLHIQNMSNDPNVWFNEQPYFPVVLDFLLGTKNVLLARDRATIMEEKQRLKYYGFPGRYRFQKYSENTNGVEYRPLSNFWTSSRFAVRDILTLANIAANIVEKQSSMRFVETFYDDIPKVYTALVKYDLEVAKDSLNKSLCWALENNFTDLAEIKYLV